MFQHVFGQCHSTETNFHCPIVLFDVMHLYYANGAASSELNLCMATLDGIGISAQMVIACLQEMNFRRNANAYTKKTICKIY